MADNRLLRAIGNGVLLMALTLLFVGVCWLCAERGFP